MIQVKDMPLSEQEYLLAVKLPSGKGCPGCDALRHCTQAVIELSILLKKSHEQTVEAMAVADAERVDTLVESVKNLNCTGCDKGV